MFDSRKEKLLFYFALLALLIVYIAGMLLDVTRDAAKYAYIAKEMIGTGNWFSLQIQGEPYLQKPQLLFWFEALSFKLFGVSNWAFRLPVIIYSLIGYYSIYRFGSKIYSKETGIIASLMLAFSTIGFLYNSDIHTDVILQTNISLALWMLWGFLNKQSYKYMIGSGVALGLCLLTKGPFGVLVPFFAVVGYLFATRRIWELVSLKWILIVIIAFAVASPGLIVQFAENGWNGLWFFFWQNNVGRVTGSYLGITTDPVYYIHNLIYLFLPWTIFLFAGSYFQFRNLLSRKMGNNELFVFWGTWVVFLLLSVSMSKLPNYIQSVLPLFAITSAKTWIEHTRGEHLRKWRNAQNILILSIWILILVITAVIIKPATWLIWPIMFALIAIVFVVVGDSKQALFLKSIYTLLAIGVLLNGNALREMFGNQAQPKAAKIINTEIGTNEKVYNYNVIALERKALTVTDEKPDSLHDFEVTPNEKHFHLNYELMFYCNEPVIHIENEEQCKSASTNPGAWIFTDEKGRNKLTEFHSNYDRIIEFKHFDLRRSARFINPKTRKDALEKFYLMHVSN